MKKIKDNNGITLIEIIISIAILSIIAISFMSFFTSGYTFVNNAGNKSKAGFIAQQAVDNGLAGATPGPDVTVSQTSVSITIQLPSPPPSPMTQAGKVMTVISDVNGKSSTIKTFVP